MQNISIIGSGLTGPLLANMLANKGYKVDLYEKRNDLRKTNNSAGRSINLALSHRGICALESAQLFEKIKPLLIPMKGRMVHLIDGSLDFQPYSIKDTNYINSISRAELNKILMNEAEKTGLVNIYFNQELIDLNQKKLTFSNGISKINEGIIIGADGVGSKIRKFIDTKSHSPSLSVPLDHSYKELTILPNFKGEYKLEANALHIWPRKNFMLIALPNTDKSFTCTLFMPNKGELSFNSLNKTDEVINFFKKYFPDTIHLLDNFPASFFQNPKGELATIYCENWHLENLCLIGDAAHAIVPFFGQGMNASFEDCQILIDCIQKTDSDWNTTFNEFYQIRKPNTDAIAKMAIENYVEMRDSVVNSDYLNQKKISNNLYKQFPNQFIPRYDMVSFTSIPYSKVLKRNEIQKQIISQIIEGKTNIKKVESIIKQKLPKII